MKTHIRETLKIWPIQIKFFVSIGFKVFNIRLGLLMSQNLAYEGWDWLYTRLYTIIVVIIIIIIVTFSSYDQMIIIRLRSSDDNTQVEIGGNALIECLTAAHPKSLNFWHDKNDLFIRSDQRWWSWCYWWFFLSSYFYFQEWEVHQHSGGGHPIILQCTDAPPDTQCLM